MTRTQATMSIMDHHIAPQRDRGVIVDTTCSVGNVAHDYGESGSKPEHHSIILRVDACYSWCKSPAHRSIMSAIAQANICKPSGICNATILEPFFRMWWTVLCSSKE